MPQGKEPDNIWADKEVTKEAPDVQASSHRPSISADFYQTVLSSYRSPEYFRKLAKQSRKAAGLNHTP